jgi:hypothetical protein
MDYRLTSQPPMMTAALMQFTPSALFNRRKSMRLAGYRKSTERKF